MKLTRKYKNRKKTNAHKNNKQQLIECDVSRYGAAKFDVFDGDSDIVYRLPFIIFVNKIIYNLMKRISFLMLCVVIELCGRKKNHNIEKGI